MNTKKLESKLHGGLFKLLKVKNVFNAVLAVQSENRELDWAGAVGYADHTEKAKMQVDTPYFVRYVSL